MTAEGVCDLDLELDVVMDRGGESRYKNESLV